MYLKRIYNNPKAVRINYIGDDVIIHSNQIDIINSENTLVDKINFNESDEVLITDGSGNIIHTVYSK